MENAPFTLLLALCAGVVVVAQIAVMVRFARRLQGVFSRLQDPRALGAMLSEETREALRNRGVDPDALTLASLRDAPELKERVSGELRGAFDSEMRAEGGKLVAGGRLALFRRDRAATAARSYAVPGPLDHSGSQDGFAARPEAIDAPRSTTLRTIVVAIAAGATAAALARWFGWL